MNLECNYAALRRLATASSFSSTCNSLLSFVYSQQLPCTDDQMADKDPLPFELKSAIPKVGMRLADDHTHKKWILGRRQWDAQVVWALCADMEERDKSLVESLVSPVFHKAAKMIEEGALSVLVGNRDVRRVDGRVVWARFLAKLQSESPKKWPRKLPVERFSQFISALAEARWWEIQLPKKTDESMACWLSTSPCF